ncbi:hypothetical protein VULLAG_LOCUS4675 [Vulpes lagopus]
MGRAGSFLPIVPKRYSLIFTVGCDHLSEDEMTLVSMRPQTPATKTPGCLLGSGKALTDVLPSLALISHVSAPHSPFSEYPCHWAPPEPSHIVLPALERGLPSPFSGRKCNA